VQVASLKKWTAESIERSLERGDSITGRLAHIGRNLLICLGVLVILGGATFGVIQGEVPTPAMFGVNIEVAPSSDAEGDNSEPGGPRGGNAGCGQEPVPVTFGPFELRS
jgi:hypothetical protein